MSGKSNGVIWKNDNFFYWIFAFWYSTEIILKANTETILGIPIAYWNEIVSWTVFIFLMIQILFLQWYTFNQFLVILVITFFLSLSVCISHNRQILSVWMFIVGAKNIDFEKTIALARNILLITGSGIIVFCLFGILKDNTVYRSGIARYSLGFAHPNQLGLRIFQFVLCSLYLKRENISFGKMLMILFAAAFCYLVPNSQTASLSLAALFILLGGHLLVKRYVSTQNRMFANGMIVAAGAVNIGSIALSLIDVTEFPTLSTFDRILSSRFSYCHEDYLLYGIKIFGNRVYVSEAEQALVGVTRKLFLDNAYMHLLLWYGVISWLICSAMYLINMVNQKNEGNDIMVIILFLYAIYGIMENGLFAINHNIFILTLSFLLYSRSTESNFENIFKSIRLIEIEAKVPKVKR